VKKILLFFHRLPGSPASRLAMPKLARMVLMAAVLVITAPLLTAAYGPETVKRMTDVTLRLAPRSLRAALLANRDHLDRGVADALSTYATSPARDILAEAQKEYAGIPALPNSQVPMEQIAYHFGKLAGLVYAVNDPFTRWQDGRAREIHQDYQKYIERKLPLIFLAFDGYASPPLQGDLQAYLSARMAGEERYREAVLFCYYEEGRRVSSQTFDDQSNAFGAAQVILSHGVSDAAKAWLEVWRAMDGDLSATPYYRPAELKPGRDPAHAK